MSMRGTRRACPNGNFAGGDKSDVSLYCFDVPFHVFKRLNMSSWKTRYLVLKLSNVELSLGLDA